MQKIQLDSIINQKPNYKVKHDDKVWLLVPVDKSKRSDDTVLKINETAAWLWENLSEKASVESLSIKLQEKYKIDAGKAKKDVEDFLNDLGKYLK